MVYFDKILSIVVWLPIIIGLLGLIINTKSFHKFFVLTGIINFIFSGMILYVFSISKHKWQFIEYYPILPKLGINYALGVDGISVLLLGLSCIINLLIFLSNSQIDKISERNKANLMILHGITNGILTATNAGLFYIFGEVMLIPLFFIICSYKNLNNIYTTFKFLFYNFLSSTLFLIIIIYLRKVAIEQGISMDHSLELNNFYHLSINFKQQINLFIALIIAFGIKTAIVPLHGWALDLQEGSPIIAAIFLTAIFLKLGVLTILRFLLPISAKACIYFSQTIIIISLVTIIYISLIAMMQNNFKKLIAYSSIMQISFIILGIFVGISLITQDQDLAIASFSGSIVQILSNSLIITGLFFCEGMLFNRLNTNELKNIKGLVYSMPILSWLLMFFCLAYIGIPGTSSFFSRFLIILASFKLQNFFGILAAISIIITLGYMMWNYKNLVFESELNNPNQLLDDLNWNEILILGILGILILIIGIYPDFCFKIIKNSINDLILIMDLK